tara:strand:- start:859 stop:1056 length:198 start_codon:yes stop_codon:yes gene_type:complete
MEFLELCKSVGLNKRKLGKITKLSQPTIKLYCEKPYKFPVGKIIDIADESLLEELEILETIKKQK